MSATAAAAEGSKAHSRVKALTGPLHTWTHTIQYQACTGYTPSPPRRHSKPGTRDPIAPQKGSEATPPKKATHRVPLHVDTASNARARPGFPESSLTGHGTKYRAASPPQNPATPSHLPTRKPLAGSSPGFEAHPERH